MFCVVAALATSGCIHGSEDGAAKPRSAKGQVQLLSPGSGADYDLVMSAAGYGAAQVGRDPAGDQYVANQCGLSEVKSPTAGFVIPAAVLTMVAGWVIDYAIAQASAAAQRRIAEYSGLSAGAVWFGPTLNTMPLPKFFYSSISPPTMDWSCVRFSRMTPANDGAPAKLAAEAIVKFQVAPTNDSLMVQPLRLFFDTPLARAGSDFGVAVAVSFDGLWQSASTGEGKAVRIWDATVLKQKLGDLSKNDRPRFFYYRNDPTQTENQPRQVPLVPWSYNVSRAGTRAGAGTLTVTLAEAGDPPFLLTFFAGLLKDKGDAIGGVLKDAAKSAIGE